MKFKDKDKDKHKSLIEYIYLDEELKEDDVFFEFNNIIDFDEFIGGDRDGEK